MIIGLDGSRAFLKYRTGIEEYSYQVIKHLRATLPPDAVVRVYVRKKISFENGWFIWKFPEIGFLLPENWSLAGLWAPRFWTQLRLSIEMLWHPVDTLFIPAHTVPVIHAKNTVVVVHGLEYEMSPQSYSWWERFYMRASIRYSVRAANTVIVVSENTKRDIERFYQVPREKIAVIYEGYEQVRQFTPGNQQHAHKEPYLLFIGRLEERKNVARIVEAFEILKSKYQLPHTLVLIGKPGYGYENIYKKIKTSQWHQSIQEMGYVSLDTKQQLLAEAKAFVFPSLYEGFGLPLLEAQVAGVPVVTSNTSSLPEVAGEGALYGDPTNSEDIAEKLYRTLTLSEEKRKDLVQKGKKNLERFSWEKCAKEISEHF